MGVFGEAGPFGEDDCVLRLEADVGRLCVYYDGFGEGPVEVGKVLGNVLVWRCCGQEELMQSGVGERGRGEVMLTLTCSPFMYRVASRKRGNMINL